jgi:peptidoglycan/LPS O-acetylase OafA/YrhL
VALASARDYRLDVDGLRAVAVSVVVGFHAFPALMPGGFVGVDVFFAISGYLITTLILVHQSAGIFSLRRFYARRARRILPALAIVLTATLAFGAFLLLPHALRKLGLHAIAGALFVPNFVFWSETGYFDTAAVTKPLLHLWSLGVEEQFYLVWPLTLIVIRWRRQDPFPILAVLTAFSLAYSAVEAFHDQVAAFYSPVSRLWELGAGALLAVRPLKVPFPRALSYVGLAIIMASALLLTTSAPFPGLLAIPPVLGSLMVLAGRSPFLTWRALVEIGLVSYPLYLWHWPLLSFAFTSGWSGPLQRVAIVLASVFLAVATTRFIEAPIRFGRFQSRGAGLAVAFTAIALVLSVAVYASAGLPARYAPEIRPTLAAMDYQFRAAARAGTCWIAVTRPFSDYKPECSHGDVLVWGDSYSALLATGLPMPYAQFTRNGCLPLIADGPQAKLISGAPADANPCVNGNRDALEAIGRAKPRRVILFGAWLFHAANWQADPDLVMPLRGTLQALRARGVVDAVVVGPSPSWAPSLPERVYKYWQDHKSVPDRLPVPPEGYVATDAVMRRVAGEEGAGFASIFNLLCDPGGDCLTHTPAPASVPLAWDHGHMTIEGAAYVDRALGLGRPN